MLRHRYSVLRFYPVYDVTNKVKYTTSYKSYFIFKFSALIYQSVLRLYDLVVSKNRKYYSSHLSYIPKYYIDTELDLDYQDEPPWRSYHLYASGDNLTELLTDATISEIDQDGGDLNTSGLEYGNSACDLAISYLEEVSGEKYFRERDLLD